MSIPYLGCFLSSTKAQLYDLMFMILVNTTATNKLVGSDKIY